MFGFFGSSSAPKDDTQSDDQPLITPVDANSQHQQPAVFDVSPPVTPTAPSPVLEIPDDTLPDMPMSFNTPPEIEQKGESEPEHAIEVLEPVTEEKSQEDTIEIVHPEPIAEKEEVAEPSPPHHTEAAPREVVEAGFPDQVSDQVVSILEQSVLSEQKAINEEAGALEIHRQSLIAKKKEIEEMQAEILSHQKSINDAEGQIKEREDQLKARKEKIEHVKKELE